jgi:hypothetical protein
MAEEELDAVLLAAEPSGPFSPWQEKKTGHFPQTVKGVVTIPVTVRNS